MSRRILPLVLGLALVTPTTTRADEPDARALAAQLSDRDLDVAYAASEKLLALGAHAKPAIPALVDALDRTLPPGIARMHWHKWMAVLPKFHSNVIRAIDQISPTDGAAIPALVRHLDHSSREDRSLVVRMLLRLWPHDPAARATLLSVTAAGAPQLDDAARVRLRAWLSDEGPAAIPALDGLLEKGRAEDPAFAAERLHALGGLGLEVLLRHFREEGTHGKAMLLKLWTGSGKLPEAAMPTAIEWVARDGDAALARAIESSTTDVDAVAVALAKALHGELFHMPGWSALCKATPDLSRRAGRHWFDAHRPAATARPFDVAGLRRTPLLGGKGGSEFELVSARGTLVGLRYTYGLQNWKPVIRSLQPLFETPDGPIEGQVVGGKGPKSGEIRAIEGYAIGGLYAQATDRFEGFAVLFMRTRGVTLDPTDAYVHSWHGSATIGREEHPIGGEGRRIVGLVGRSGADIDALGLVEAR